ncbi:MAG: sulfite exporter TauE/SafE family protein [Candidatus Polarisedimenticolia bacterium]
MPLEAWTYPILLSSGLVAGLLNVVAGGGSFLTLPILIFMGLPPVTANGTNRVGILLQNIAAVWSFRRDKVIEPGWAAATAAPSVLGAALGTLLAIWIDDQTFRQVLSILMIVMSLWTLWDPIRPRRDSAGGPVKLGAATLAGFFLAGIYGGFVQAGVGFLLLVVTTLSGLDLVRGNSLKVLSLLISTPLSLAIFWWQGHVWWVPGLWLGAGTLMGGFLGARLTVLKGHQWVRRVVTITVIAMALKLWLGR